MMGADAGWQKLELKRREGSNSREHVGSEKVLTSIEETCLEVVLMLWGEQLPEWELEDGGERMDMQYGKALENKVTRTTGKKAGALCTWPWTRGWLEAFSTLVRGRKREKMGKFAGKFIRW